METETLTFDFGTTPEEVIRERVAWFFDEVVINKYDSFAPCPPILNGNTTHPDARDDLLTVLDALALSAATVRYRTDRKDGTPMFNCDGEGNRLPDYMQAACGQDESRRLRIEILAALGIKEG